MKTDLSGTAGFDLLSMTTKGIRANQIPVIGSRQNELVTMLTKTLTGPVLSNFSTCHGLLDIQQQRVMTMLTDFRCAAVVKHHSNREQTLISSFFFGIAIRM